MGAGREANQAEGARPRAQQLAIHGGELATAERPNAFWTSASNTFEVQDGTTEEGLFNVTGNINIEGNVGSSSAALSSRSPASPPANAR